ncbi:hypothetical protein GOP47_0014172 [Adiantum capillus-veneris]|uniref:Uncharacterized protein n=1 Tax=Adiantum capillus-veneris TaxID=13818 RepID=A0A9D4ZGH2_ADICA|nr:hypothetical protein GOP47_0014172 [Adiantum capillus-veneris]
MLRAYRAITSSCRYTGCGHGERAWRYSTFSGDLQEYEALASNVSSALAGMGLAASQLSSLCSSPRLWTQTAFFKGLGIDTDGFCKIIYAFPQALILNPDTDLKVSIAHLEAALGKSLLAECILSWPSLLGLGFPLESTQKLDLRIIDQGLKPARSGLGSVQHELREGGSQEVHSLKFGTRLCEGLECSSQGAVFDSRSTHIWLPQQEFSGKLDFLLKCGFKRNTRLLARALFCALHKKKEDIDAIVYAHMSLGLSRKHAGHLIKLQPPILQQRPDEVAQKLDYILNTLSFSTEDLFKYSSFMLYNLDTHIRPRYLMHAWIKSKRFLRRNFKLDYIMSMPERDFSKKFVECHEGGVNMYHKFMQSGK